MLKRQKRNKWLEKLCNFLSCKGAQDNYAVEIIESLYFSKAPEPNDIKWENLNYKFRKCTVIATSLASCFLILISLGLNYILKNLTENDARTLSTLERRFYSFVIASIIACINYLLKWTIKYLTSFENQRTHTEFNLSVAVKLTAARFVNSAIVPVIINI